MHFCVHSDFIGACCHANFPFLILALHYWAWFQCRVLSAKLRPAAILLQNSSLSVYWPKAILIYLFSKVHSEHFLFQYYGCSHVLFLFLVFPPFSFYSLSMINWDTHTTTRAVFFTVKWKNVQQHLRWFNQNVSHKK